jgi:hypothetical protein
MPPPAAFPSSPGEAAAALIRHLTARGITGIYTATTDKFAVISVTADLTMWTNGSQLWCTCRGQRHSWPASDMRAAAAGVAALARP